MAWIARRVHSDGTSTVYSVEGYFHGYFTGLQGSTMARLGYLPIGYHEGWLDGWGEFLVNGQNRDQGTTKAIEIMDWLIATGQVLGQEE